MSLLSDMIVAGIKGIKFNPIFYKDKRYKVWICMLSPSTCKPCFDLHGKLYLPKMRRQDFLNYTKIVLVLLYGLNLLKKEHVLLKVKRG